MNERIRKLAEQATLPGYMLGESYVQSRLDEQKFAELIVRECSKIADLADESKCEWIGGNILTHFGINND